MEQDEPCDEHHEACGPVNGERGRSAPVGCKDVGHVAERDEGKDEKD